MNQERAEMNQELAEIKEDPAEMYQKTKQRRYETDDVEDTPPPQKRRPPSPSRPPPPSRSLRYASPEPEERIVFLVPLIFVACIVVFFVTMYYNNCPRNSKHCILHWLHRFAFQPLRENPLLGPTGSTLQKMGGLRQNLVVHKHQGWRLVTCLWLHTGVFHLVGSMILLLKIGVPLEREQGYMVVGILYLVGGFGGSLMSALFVQNEVSVGASGAVFGFLGAIFPDKFFSGTYSKGDLLIFCGAIIVFGLMPHVGNWVHVGGFIGGILLGEFIFAKGRKGRCAAIVLAAGYCVAAVFLFKGVNANKHCHWCHYLSCVNTTVWHCSNF